MNESKASLPALIVIDVPDSHETNNSRAFYASESQIGSFSNQEEANTVFRLTQALLLKGIMTHQIGIITLYHQQRIALAERLSKLRVDVPSNIQQLEWDRLDHKRIQAANAQSVYEKGRKTKSSKKQQDMENETVSSTPPPVRGRPKQNVDRVSYGSSIQTSTVDAFQVCKFTKIHT
jgi:hypothetical protein